MNDKQAGVAMVAVIELANRMREQGSPTQITHGAQQVIDACGGDPIAALCLMAAVVPPEDQLDPWWQDAGIDIGVKKRAFIEQAIARHGFDVGRVTVATGCTQQEYRVVKRSMDRRATG